MPKISIIICNYGHDGYLPFAVESVLSQKFEDWELIIANDDPEARNIYHHLDTRISTWDAVERLGQPARINKCVNYISSEFVAFLDADDYFFPWKLDYQLENMKGYDISYSDCVVQYPDGRMKLNHTQAWDRNIVLHKQTITTFSSIVVRTSFLKQCPFPEDVRYGNDRCWALDVSLLTDKIKYLPMPLFVYRDFSSVYGGRFNFNPISKFNNLLRRIDRKKKQRKLQRLINERYDVK